MQKDVFALQFIFSVSVPPLMFVQLCVNTSYRLHGTTTVWPVGLQSVLSTGLLFEVSS